MPHKSTPQNISRFRGPMGGKGLVRLERICDHCGNRGTKKNTITLVNISSLGLNVHKKCLKEWQKLR